MNKAYPRALRDLVGGVFAEAFARQGFASTQLVTRWADIVGPRLAAHSEPLRIQWPRQSPSPQPEPGTLILRVEGPDALEIQHASDVILQKVNQFFGWRAIGRIALRQAPLARRAAKPARADPDAETAAALAAGFSDIGDAQLRQALGRLGAAVRRAARR